MTGIYLYSLQSIFELCNTEQKNDIISVHTGNEPKYSKINKKTKEKKLCCVFVSKIVI